MYVFDYTNVEDLLQGAKPILVQKGPYHFMEYFRKFDISWSDDGDTVTYNTQKYFVYNAVGSGDGLSLDDRLTIPYASVVGFEWLLRSIPQDTNAVVEQTLQQVLFVPLEAQLAAAYNSTDDAETRAQIEYAQSILAEVEQVGFTLND